MSASEPSLTLRASTAVRQTRIALFAGFGGLLLLMLLLGASAISSMYQVEVREEEIRADYVERNRAIDTLRSNIYLSGTRIREYLLEPADELAGQRRAQYEDTRHLIEDEAQAYDKRVTAQSREPFHELEQAL